MTSLLWYRVGLRDDLIAGDQVAKIRERFTEAIGAAGWPLGACLFLVTRDSRRGRLRKDDEEGQVVFFSPAAIAAVPHLIAACGAEPGPPPDRACATLLAGEESDWDLLPYQAH